MGHAFKCHLPPTDLLDSRNFIADVPEYSGLLTKDQTLVLLDGRPSLDPSAASESEAELMNVHRKAFEDLNVTVRSFVIGSVGRQKRSKGCVIGETSHRGTSLGQLRTFARKVSRAFKKMWPQVPFEEISAKQVDQHFIQPQTQARGCSYVELVANGPQYPSIYVDYQASSSFSDIMASVEWLAEAMKLKDTEVLFFYLLGRNKHESPEQIRANECDKDQNLIIDRAQSQCHSFLITSSVRILDKDKWSLCRAWRLYNIECAVRLGQAIYIACSSGAMACTNLFPNGHSKVGSMDPTITKAIFDIYEEDIRHAPISVRDQGEKIWNFLKEGHKGAGVQHLQRRLQRWSLSWPQHNCKVLRIYCILLRFIVYSIYLHQDQASWTSIQFTYDRDVAKQTASVSPPFSRSLENLKPFAVFPRDVVDGGLRSAFHLVLELATSQELTALQEVMAVPGFSIQAASGPNDRASSK